MIRVYFAFEVTFVTVYLALFTTYGFRIVKCQSLTTLSCGKMNSVGSFPKHTRRSPNTTVERNKIAYLAMFLAHCLPELVRLLIEVREEDNDKPANGQTPPPMHVYHCGSHDQNVQKFEHQRDTVWFANSIRGELYKENG